MPNCPKCGARVTEAMSYCPSCGTSLKAPPAPAVAPAPAAPAPAPPPRREEKAEKREKEEKGEKREKTEKGEKHEKQTFGPIGPIVGGIALVAIGVLFFLSLQPGINQPMLWAYFFVIIGIVVILAAIYGTMIASRRHPPT